MNENLYSILEDEKNINISVINSTNSLLQTLCYDGPRDIRSMTKSIMSLLVGISISKNYIKSTDTRIQDYLPNAPSSLTIRDLLLMCSGFDIDDHQLNHLISGSTHWVDDILKLPTEAPSFKYKGVDYHLLSAILTKATGVSALEFAEEFLFSPLEINDFKWSTDPDGYNVGSTSLKLPFDGLVKLSKLLLQNGTYLDMEILPAEWLRLAASTQISTTLPYGNYGYGFWTSSFKNHHLYRAIGTGGQQILIIPDKDIAIVLTADPKEFNFERSENVTNRILRMMIE
ncbi:serine hydrolase domain-containing protein [Bacillus salitolerans]|uniref:Serine hydrolase domain-containing protein n=1 Tax=Bacillus salitolerans TaxID=1437434 RepID=A0ABW4LL73_9BACI